jgi:hypothetical protein
MHPDGDGIGELDGEKDAKCRDPQRCAGPVRGGACRGSTTASHVITSPQRFKLN